ncbi:MAG: transposase [Gemmatimonadales bacterium]
MIQGRFYWYRRRLPHWRLSGATYFVTWRLHRQQMDLEPFERTLVEEALRHFDAVRYQLFGYVVMNDHVHVLLSLLGDHELAGILHSWKSFTAHELRKISGRSAPVWQDEAHDRIVRDEREQRIKLNYILNNPRRRWPSIERYPWMWTIGQSWP